MVRIRLTRVGAKKQPSYRIVITDKRKPRDSDYKEKIGWYNPRTEPSTEVVDEARALYWLSVGAQPSDAVVSIFKRTGTWERFQRWRDGEDIDALVAEAEEEEKELPEQRTEFPAPAAGKSKIKAREAEAVLEAEGDSDEADDEASE
jgi:small subunit ribosomal protein S16